MKIFAHNKASLPWAGSKGVDLEAGKSASHSAGAGLQDFPDGAKLRKSEELLQWDKEKVLCAAFPC